MSLMSKLLMSLLVATATLNAGLSTDDLRDYFKQFVIRSQSTEVTNVKIKEQKRLTEDPKWEQYVVSMSAKQDGKDIPINISVFTDGSLITSVLIDTKNGVDYTRRVTENKGSLFKDAKDYTVDQSVLLRYIENFYIKPPFNKNIKLELVDTIAISGHEGWNAYLTTVSFDAKGQNMKLPVMIFSNGIFMTHELIDFNEKIDYSRELRPKASEKYYNKSHLLFGNPDAKHNIIVFTDPQCPFCLEVVPELMTAAKNNPDIFALYYYHLPLVRIHPVSDILVRVMHVAQSLGRSDVIEKLYKLQINVEETDVDKVLAIVKEQTGFVVTRDQIESKETKDAIKADEDAASDLMVSGTPTLYVDGAWDKTRELYKSFIPKK